MGTEAMANQVKVTANQIETPPPPPPGPVESAIVYANDLLGKVDDTLLKGLESMLFERPLDPVEYMASYLMDRTQNKKSPQTSRHDHGPLPPKFSCGCVPGPLLPPTSCGCFVEKGWEIPPVVVQPSAEVDSTSLQAIERLNAVPLA